MKDVVLVIPSLNPDEKIIRLIKELKNNNFENIIVVNDGSNTDTYFKKLDCIILNHETNLGKGQALKTAFKYYLDNFNSYKGIVMLDSDYQHSVKDVCKVAKLIKKNTLILGVRDFNNKNVPFKSKFGNKITSFVFNKKYGKYISDTQTGLRGISSDLIEKFVTLEGDRFEYEINMLKDSIKINVLIKEVKIDTIYIEKNKSSNFKVLKDSYKIYKEMLKK